MRAISFVSGGDKISGNLCEPTRLSDVAFLFIQGWLGHQNVAAAGALADLGFTSMTYDMRGNGTSEGDLTKLSRVDFLHDAIAAYDYLKQQLGEHTNIAVVGSSFGAYTAVLLSQKRPVFGLSLRVPANYPDEGFDKPQLEQKRVLGDFTNWRHKKHTPANNRALRALHAFTRKVQIVEAGADEQVPHQVAEDYSNAVASKQQLSYSVMEGAPHSLVNEQLSAEYVDLLRQWAASAL